MSEKLTLKGHEAKFMEYVGELEAAVRSVIRYAELTAL